MSDHDLITEAFSNREASRSRLNEHATKYNGKAVTVL